MRQGNIGYKEEVRHFLETPPRGVFTRRRDARYFVLGMLLMMANLRKYGRGGREILESILTGLIVSLSNC